MDRIITSTSSPILQNLVGMIDAFGPRHLADVDQPFDARFELHERTVTHHVHDLTVVLLADFVLLFDVVPRIRLASA